MRLSWFLDLLIANRSKLQHDTRRKGRRSRKLLFDRLERRDLLAANVVGDFNGDGADDLAVGAPNETVGIKTSAGGVHVIYGSNGVGLTSTGNQFWTQHMAGMNELSEPFDHFGSVLGAGDFNGDGFDDLAIGVPLEDRTSVDGGLVQVMYGSIDGLTTAGIQLLTGGSGTNSQFGAALAIGDFDFDGLDDLAIGIPYSSSHPDHVPGVPSAGAVQVSFGSLGAGLAINRGQRWDQDRPGILDFAESGDQFGFSLAAGDFDGDGRDDLAIGVPGESIGAAGSAEGAVNVLYSSTGFALTRTGNQFWHQNTSGVLDVAETGDRFGTSLTAGDFNGDLYDDLAIGVPMEDIGAALDAGAVNVLYGGAGRLSSTGNQFWNQNSSGILDVAESNTDGSDPAFGDYFGASLQAGDFNRDDKDDLVIGVPGESFAGGLFAAGAVNAIYGSLGGLSSAGNQFWHQNSSGILDELGSRDYFGFAVAVGDFNNDSRTDLVVGVPRETVSGLSQAGAVNVIYGSDTGLVSAGNQFWHQNISGILDFAEPEDIFGTAVLGGTSLTDVFDIFAL